MKLQAALCAFVFSLSAFAQIHTSGTDMFWQASNDNRGKTGAQIKAESLANYERFVALDVNAIAPAREQITDARKPKSLSRANADFVLQQSEANPVVSQYQYYKYDPANKGIGFCFGRAMFINLFLAQAGFNRANIKKAFIVGPMDNGAWGWHVSTIVQSKHAGKEIWLAIDPAAGQVMEVKAWYAHWSKSSDDGKLRLYIAHSGKFGAGSSRYDEQAMRSPFYNNYFTDMMTWLNDNDVSTAIKF